MTFITLLSSMHPDRRPTVLQAEMENKTVSLTRLRTWEYHRILPSRYTWKSSTYKRKYHKTFGISPLFLIYLFIDTVQVSVCLLMPHMLANVCGCLKIARPGVSRRLGRQTRRYREATRPHWSKQEVLLAPVQQILILSFWAFWCVFMMLMMRFGKRRVSDLYVYLFVLWKPKSLMLPYLPLALYCLIFQSASCSLLSLCNTSSVETESVSCASLWLPSVCGEASRSIPV